MTIFDVIKYPITLSTITQEEWILVPLEIRYEILRRYMKIDYNERTNSIVTKMIRDVLAEYNTQ